MLKTYIVKLLLLFFPYRQAVRDEVAAASKLSVRGERKRSYVLNVLRDKFPDAEAKNLALTIELVLQEA